MRKSKRLFIMVLGLTLCLAVSVGMAVAYFTDYENARGGAVLHLTGETELTEDVDEAGKTVSIKNTGDSDVVVRVMFIGDEAHMGDVTLGNGWSGPDDDGWYYYGNVLSKDESTSDVKAVVNAGADEDITDFDIIVVHEFERVVYEDSVDADGNVVQKVSIPDGWAISSIGE